MLILFSVLAYIYVCCSSTVLVKDANIATLRRDDIGMIFYLTLENTNSRKYFINIAMIKCCEVLSVTDMDCETMQLLGGDMGILNPKTVKNVSLLYPNMYLHNRKGQCLVSIKYASESNETPKDVRQQIAFDTTICKKKPPPPVLRGYYQNYEVSKCDSIDQDPLDKCEAVNCRMKFLGSRNYYNHKWKRCQKVPICVADCADEMPDVLYMPTSNKCRDLSNVIGQKDLRFLERGNAQGSWISQSYPVLSANLRCHHGYLDNATSFCICDDGWTSAPFDKDQYEPNLSVYHMCNIEIDSWQGINRTKLKMTALVIAVFAVAIAMLIIILTFMLHMLYICIKSYESPPPNDEESCTNAGGNLNEDESDEEVEEQKSSDVPNWKDDTSERRISISFTDQPSEFSAEG